MLVAAVTCVGFASCGDDEKEDIIEEVATESQESIVGTWKCTSSNDTIMAIFKEDGNGTMVECRPFFGSISANYDFGWALTDDEKLYVIFEHGRTGTYYLERINANQIVCHIDDEVMICNRVAEPNDGFTLVGIWKWASTDHPTAYMLITFKENGYCEMKQFRDGNMIDSYSYEWTLFGSEALALSESYLCNLTIINNNTIECVVDGESATWIRQ